MKAPDNIQSVLRTISEYHASILEVKFIDECKAKWNEFNISSPIEMVMMVALICIGYANDLKGKIEIHPQYHIGQYRVDFFIKAKNNIVVECDSQSFHERTEAERSYEKKRDRYLQKNNYKVFRFTGREILTNPLVLANETIAFALGISENELRSTNKWGR